MNRALLSLLVCTLGLLWLAILRIEGVPASLAWLRPSVIVVTAATGLLWAWDNMLWRTRPFSLLRKRLDLNGTWKAVLRPEESKRIAAYWVVWQTASRLMARLYTSESYSSTVVATLNMEDDGAATVSSVYRNEPRLRVREESDMHYGGLILRTADALATKLEGQYWTDRGTKGEMTAERISRDHARSFAEARAIEERTPSK